MIWKNIKYCIVPLPGLTTAHKQTRVQISWNITVDRCTWWTDHFSLFSGDKWSCKSSRTAQIFKYSAILKLCSILSTTSICHASVNRAPHFTGAYSSILPTGFICKSIFDILFYSSVPSDYRTIFPFLESHGIHRGCNYFFAASLNVLFPIDPHIFTSFPTFKKTSGTNSCIFAIWLKSITLRTTELSV